MGNILIVDDSSLIRTVASEATVEAGHTPILAVNGEDGLKKLEENYIDLVFSDINMPVMNGLDMVAKIKENDQYKFVPIIMLTTENNPDLKARGKELGVKAWLLKPFNREKFFTAVQKLIRT